jgi:lipopolysaccharide transport system ATP-binding protein
MGRDIVIRAEGLGKKYVLGHQAERERYTALRDVIARNLRGWARTAREMVHGRPIITGDETEEFWALKDVSFEINRGEVVGIIGRNGAGKSTLLKILSRITEPSEGRVKIEGRVASLLEVGTGFHPELTGRENIYLNGAILGMSRSEIASKFDEIVAFAEVEKFLDTPVKRYSSGMYVRLAFAVAAHLEPEILIVDEVLAVGDVEFQKKCLGKMGEVATHGRTVLFVSHNMAAVEALTQSTLVLKNGRIVMQAVSKSAIEHYLRGQTSNAIEYQAHPSQSTRDTPYIAGARVITSTQTDVHQFGTVLRFEFIIYNTKPLNKACFSFQILNSSHAPIVHAFAYYPDYVLCTDGGVLKLSCILPEPKLNVGKYFVTMHLSEPPGGMLWETVDEAFSFVVVRTDSSPLWGWQPEACAYFEDFHWVVTQR